MNDETELRPWVKVFGIILLIALIVGCIYLLKAEMKQPSIINVDNDVNPIKDPRINRVYTDAFTISEHTDYDLTHNTVYLTITENIGKNQIINISSLFKDNPLTNKISYSDIYMNLSYDYKVFGTAYVSIGKYSKSNTTFESIINSTVTHYYYSNDTEMFCQSVLADKSCMVESWDNIRNETRWDYQPLPQQKDKIVLNGLSVEFKNGGIPIAKNSTIQLRYSYEHPLAITKNTPAADVNKYDIEVCNADGIDCSILDPTWFNTSWSKRKQMNITTNISITTYYNYSVCANVTFDADMRTDFGDLRILNDTNSEIPYWFYDDVVYASASAYLCFFSGTNDNQTFWLYYGNAAATNNSNIQNAFWLGDHFDTIGINTTKWRASGVKSYTSSGDGGMNITFNGSVGSAYFQSAFPVNTSNNGLGIEYATRTQWKYDYPPGGYEYLGFVGAPGTTSYNPFIGSYTWQDLLNKKGYGTYFGAEKSVARTTNYSTAYFVFKGKANTTYWEIYENNVLMYRNTSSVSTANLYSQVAGAAGPGDATYLHQWMYVRPIAPIEPTVTFGGEEAQTVDNDYPSFSTYWDNNGTLVNSGIALFNVTLAKTNGTVLLEIGGTNYTARNITADVYNVSVSLTGGVYSYHWNSWGNGTNRNFNTSDVRAYTVNVTDPDYPIFFGESTTANGSTYNPATNYAFSIYINNTNGTAGIEFNGTNYTMQNASSQFTKILSQQRAGVFSYYYWSYGNGSSANFNRTTAKAYTILQATNTQSLLLNGTAANVNLTYPSKVNATGTCTVGASLTENITVITSGLFRDLKVGYYNYTLTCTGNENYTTLAAISRFANITKGTGVVYTYLNGARNNLTISNGTTATLNGTLSSGSGTINLYQNDSLINTGTPSVQNSTLFNKIENWTIKANYTGNENWTAASEQWTLTVAAVGTITTALDSPIDNYKTNVSSVYFNWTITPNQMNITNWTYSLWNASSATYNVSYNPHTYMCYQETANASSSSDGNCGLTYNGVYQNSTSFNSNIDVIRIFDGNWSSNGLAKVNVPANLLINYSMPIQYVNEVYWEVKQGDSVLITNITNYTIPNTCINRSIGKIILKLYALSASGSIREGSGYCLNSSNNWQQLFNKSLLYADYFYEEAIIWNVSYNVGNSKNESLSLSLSDGNYTWGVSACGNNSAGDYACNTAANRTITVDTVTPTISLIYPTNSTGLGTIGTNYTLNYTITDLNPQTCGFVYNGVTSYMDCASYATFIFSNNRSITLFANDSAGNSKSTTYDKLFLIIENNQTYTSPVDEMSYQYFNINLTYNSTLFPGISANFIYNGTNYTATQNGTGDTIIFQRTIDVPLSGVKNLYWNIGITNTSGTFYYNSSVKTQSISGITLAFCNTTFNDTLVNFSVYDAQTVTKKVNSTFDIDFTYWTGSGRDSKNYSYKDTNKNVSSFKFCASPSNITYYVDADITFTGTGYAQNYHYFRNATLNATILEQPLYLLNAGNATITQLRILDAYQDGVPDRLIQIQYYDVGTGTYYLVGMAKTNYDGSDFVYLKWYDTYYKFIGTDFDGNVILNYDPYKVGESPQTFKLGSTFTFDYNKFNDMTYNLYFNNATKNVVLTFLDPSGTITSGCLRVYRFSATNETIVYDECLATTSGTLTYNMGNQTGNFAATFYATGSSGVIETIGFIVDAINEIYDTLDRADSAIYAFLVVGGAIFVGLFSPVAAIVLGLAGWVVATWLGFIKMTGNQIIAFIGIFIVGIFLAWKLRN